MTLMSASELSALRDQALRLSESQRAEIASALLDSLRPPTEHRTAEELSRGVTDRAEAYHRGELPAISLEESLQQAREILARKRTS